MYSLNGHRLGVLSVRAFNEGKGVETRATRIDTIRVYSVLFCGCGEAGDWMGSLLRSAVAPVRGSWCCVARLI